MASGASCTASHFSNSLGPSEPRMVLLGSELGPQMSWNTKSKEILSDKVLKLALPEI